MGEVLKLLVTTESDDAFEIQVSGELDVETLEALCEIETGLSTSEFNLIHNGRFLTDGKKKLNEVPVQNGDAILVYRLPASSDQCSAVQESASGATATEGAAAGGGVSVGPIDAEMAAEFEALPEDRRRRLIHEANALREALLSRPEEVATLQEKNPILADALVTGDVKSFAATLYHMRRIQEKQQEVKQQQQQQRHQRNLLDPRVQEMIAEEIRQKNVEANRAAAAEFTPEMFAKVTMLFVPVKINGHVVKAFVDTGAQTTLINVPCAKRCGLMHLLDRGYSGVAYGVGTQRIIGRVHVASLQIGAKDFLPSSFNVVENEPLEMLLGLDTLKRHRCVVDMNRNELIIGSSGNGVPFLEGADLPDLSAVSRKEEAEVKDLLRDDEGGSGGGMGALTMTGEVESRLSQAFQQLRSSDESEDVGYVVNEDQVESVVQMGFDRDQVREELRRQRGDVNQTIAALLAKSLSFG